MAIYTNISANVGQKSPAIFPCHDGAGRDRSSHAVHVPGHGEESKG